MTLRILLNEDEPQSRGIAIVPPCRRAASRGDSLPAFADWDDVQVPALLLYLSDEPEVGKRFRYAEVDWEIVDYRDGWVARMMVD
jgi:hypothetical protein